MVIGDWNADDTDNADCHGFFFIKNLEKSDIDTPQYFQRFTKQNKDKLANIHYNN